jgi:hypothetical protein
MFKKEKSFLEDFSITEELKNKILEAWKKD